MAILKNRSGTISGIQWSRRRPLSFVTEKMRITTLEWLADRVDEGMMPHEIGLFVRSEAELRARSAAVKAVGHVL